MDKRFQHWSATHILIVVATFVLAGILIFIGRRNAARTFPVSIGKIIGGILLLNYACYVCYRIHSGLWMVRYDLPMELCNWAALATMFAFFLQNRTLAELAYFWVMAGSINGVISPDLAVSFPHPYFFIFFIAHSGLVIGSLYLVFGLKYYPRPGAIRRVFIISQIYLATAFVINYVLGGNYGYTMAKPGSASLFDYLGPWPYYLISLEGIALFLYGVLYLPFFFWHRHVRSR
jgi:hypothetical integral membrane protein (TIGR02206 family)